MALDWRGSPSLISERQYFARPSLVVIPAERSESRDPGAKNSVRHVQPLGPGYSPAANSGMTRMAGAQLRDDKGGGHPDIGSARVRVQLMCSLSPPLPAVSCYGPSLACDGTRGALRPPRGQDRRPEGRAAEASRSGRPEPTVSGESVSNGVEPLTAFGGYRWTACCFAWRASGGKPKGARDRNRRHAGAVRQPPGREALEPGDRFRGGPRGSPGVRKRSAVADEAPAYPSHLRLSRRGGTARA